MKAVFFDIDGTIWDEKMRIPQSTIDAITKLMDNGHLAFLCSGRSRSAIRAKHLLDIGFDGVISGCGTLIEYHGEKVFEYLMPEQDVRRLLDIGSRTGISILLEGPRYCYYRTSEFYNDDYITYLEDQLGDDLKDTDLHDTHEVNKCSVALMNADVNEVIAELGDDFDAVVHNSRVMEILPHGFSKATGIAKVCELLGIAVEDTYAFGDSSNDLDMLKFVGHGIAMGNGTDNAKQAAEYVTKRLDEDGIYAGLSHYGLI